MCQNINVKAVWDSEECCWIVNVKSENIDYNGVEYREHCYRVLAVREEAAAFAIAAHMGLDVTNLVDIENV